MSERMNLHCMGRCSLGGLAQLMAHVSVTQHRRSIGFDARLKVAGVLEAEVNRKRAVLAVHDRCSEHGGVVTITQVLLDMRLHCNAACHHGVAELIAAGHCDADPLACGERWTSIRVGILRKCSVVARVGTLHCLVCTTMRYGASRLGNGSTLIRGTPFSADDT